MADSRAPGSHWPSGTLLGDMAPPLEQELRRLGTDCAYGPGARLLSQGERSTHVIVLLAGIVKVSATSANGRNVLLAIRIAGDLVGEVAAADGKPRTATVTSCGQVRGRNIPRDEWRRFLEGHPRAHTALNRLLSERFRAETERRVELTEQPAPVRIARVLLTFERQYGRGTTNGRELTFPLSQAELAAAADCAIASVQNALAAMREQGIVETRYRRLILRDLEALARWPAVQPTAPSDR